MVHPPDFWEELTTSPTNDGVGPSRHGPGNDTGASRRMTDRQLMRASLSKDVRVNAFKFT